MTEQPGVLARAALALTDWTERWVGARDVMGDTIVVCFVLTPIVLTLVTLLGMTLPYPL